MGILTLLLELSELVSLRAGQTEDVVVIVGYVVIDEDVPAVFWVINITTGLENLRLR